MPGSEQPDPGAWGRPDSLRSHGLPAPSDRPGSPHGTVTVICGCMFSGKTTDLLRRITPLPTPRVLAVKHTIDTRYSTTAIVSHAGTGYPARAVSSAQALTGHLSQPVEIVAIDEAHFFDAHLVDVVRQLAARRLDLILTTLDRDSWGRPFDIARRLCALADEPVLKHAVCARCGARADRTQRLTPILDGNMVGGPESYEPRCRGCWSPPPETPPP